MALKLFLLIASLSGYVFVLRRWLGVPAAVGLAATIGALITFLYAADFVGWLKLAANMAYLAGWFGFVGCAWLFIKGRDPDLRGRASALPLLILVVALLCLYRLSAGGAFVSWDEFSHWGTIIKALYSADTFHFNPNPLYFQDYPPGTALFAYFVLQILGYSEGHALFSYSLLLIAFCLPLLYLAWMAGPRWGVGTVILVAILVSRLGLGHGWMTTLIDHVLSVMFGGTIAAYLLLRKKNARLWPLSIMLTALCLTKHAGQFLAILAVAVCGVDVLISRIGVSKGGITLDHAVKGMSSATTLMIGLLIVPLVMSWTWRNHVVENRLVQSFSQVSLPGLLVKSLECCSSERDIDIATGFVDKWLGLPLLREGSAGSLSEITITHFLRRLPDVAAIRGYSPASLFSLFLLAGSVGALMSRNREDRRRLLFASLMLSVGAILFSATQLLFYLYSLSDYEARALASFNRFQNIYYLGWGLAVIGLIIATRQPRGAPQLRNRHWLAIAVLGVTPYLASDRMLERLRFLAPVMGQDRSAIRDWLLPKIDFIPVPARVYIVWQGTSGIEFWMIRHETLPRKTNNDCFSLGAPHFDADIWTCPKSEAQLSAEWSEYNFVIVGRGMAGLKAHYPGLLAGIPDGIDRGILKITVGKSVSLSLLTEEGGRSRPPILNRK